MMEKNPQISVVMPAFRCADTITMAIDSVLIQDVPLELIVINDCSPDHLDAVMEPYRNHPAVRYVKNEVNLGAAASRNRGVVMARGEYVAFLDADDCWETGKLHKQLRAMEASGAVLCSTARELMTPEGLLTGRIIPVKERLTYRELLKHNAINCSSVLMKADVARAFPMHHEDSHEDYIMWLEVLREYGYACAVNEPLLKYRLTNSGKSGNKFQSAWMTFKVYRYMGFGWLCSLALFIRYACYGLLKYTATSKK